MRWIAFLLAIVAVLAAAPSTGARRPLPPTNCGEFACPPRPMPSAAPDPAALDAARRIVRALDMGIVGRRTAELRDLALAHSGPRSAPAPFNLVRATPPVDLSAIPYWSFELQERVIDHAAFYYLANYSPGELLETAGFIESTAGRRLFADSRPRAVDIERAVATPLLEDDLWDIVCAIPPRREREDGIHYRFDAFHRSLDGFERPQRGGWCAQVEASLTGDQSG